MSSVMGSVKMSSIGGSADLLHSLVKVSLAKFIIAEIFGKKFGKCGTFDFY